VAIPDFIVELRRRVGHDQLWLPGVAAVVVRQRLGRDEVLLVRRADDFEWTCVTGIVDPGEHPARTAVREIEEESQVLAEVERLVAVAVSDVVTYSNGDKARYLEHVFRCRWLEGDPAPDSEETVEAAFFAADALPDMLPRHLRPVRLALQNSPEVCLD
jgi:ADP-ribose pyrophosphatase YjhB (NUDIX family)